MKQLQRMAPILIVLLASCNQGTDTSLNTGGGSAGMWTVPGVGTTYIYSNSQQALDTLTVLNTGQHFGGKTNVVVLRTDFEGDTGIYNFESNGDFSFGQPQSTDSLGNLITTYEWTTLPTGSRRTISGPNVDTFEGSQHVIESSVISFVGVESVTTKAGQFSTLHVKTASIDDEFSNDSSITSTDTARTDFWFAPSIGLYVKVLENQTFNGQVGQNNDVELIKYSPK